MKYILASFVLVLFSTLYINFNVFQSYILQYDLIQEFNTKTLTNSTLQKIQNSNITMPNVTMTSLPLLPIYAAYKQAFGDTEQALSILNQPVNDNPYIGYRESLKSQIFYDLKVLDSSLFYAKKAYLKVPQNPIHFERLAIALAYKKEQDSLVTYFNLFQHDDEAVWKLFLASFIAIEGETPDEVISIAKRAKLKFPKSSDVSYFSNSIIYGLENVKLSSELSQKAEIFYENNDFKKAGELYEMASLKNPGIYSNFENAASCFLVTENYEKALKFSSIVLDSFNISLGKSAFTKAVSLNALGQKDEACKFIKISIKQGFKNAYPYLNQFCN